MGATWGRGEIKFGVDFGLMTRGLAGEAVYGGRRVAHITLTQAHRNLSQHKSRWT